VALQDGEDAHLLYRRRFLEAVGVDAAEEVLAELELVERLDLEGGCGGAERREGWEVRRGATREGGGGRCVGAEVGEERWVRKGWGWG
jgi:hypothetical protein